MHTSPMSLEQSLNNSVSDGKLDADLAALIRTVSSACKIIARDVGLGGLSGVLGSAESENVQGETQKKLDIISNDVLLQVVQDSGLVAGMASEEMEDIYPMPQASASGRYLLLFDPLDGSSNIDVNVSIGTIFSILPCPEGVTSPSLADFLQPGHQQVAAGYVIYGPSTMLVLTTGDGVDAYTLDRSVGEFLLTERGMQIPAETSEFAINASNQRHWEAPVQRYISECLAGKEGVRARDFNMRWIASMVADVHRVASRGGVFMYPGDAKLKAKGQAGKLRLMYEANPMSMLVTQAGGLASTGIEDILAIQPEELHQRVPVVLGSSEEVTRIVAYHQEAE